MTSEDTQYQCSECGTQVQENEKVCPKCGASLEEIIPADNTGISNLYMQAIANLLGLHYYPNKGAFKGGLVTGAKDGYLVIIGSEGLDAIKFGFTFLLHYLGFGPASLRPNRSNSAAIHVTVRFKSVDDTSEFVERITKAVEFPPELLAEPGIKELPGQFPEQMTIVGADNIRWEWAWQFIKPKPEAIELLAMSLLRAARSVAPAFDGFCEICKTKPANEIVLGNGIPGYYCIACQRTTKQVRFESLAI